MLTSLHIENIAVIEKIDIDFTDGFNVLTGETGAGKSIVIDAINAIIGERTSHDLIRTGESSAVVSAVFDGVSNETVQLLTDLGYECDDGTVMIYRKISNDGKNTVRINGMPSTVSVLKTVGTALVNIHGQHDSQALLDPAKHIDYIDAVSDSKNKLCEYTKLYCDVNDVLSRLNNLKNTASDSTQRLDYLNFVIDEIDSAKIEPGEREELIRQRDMIRNSVGIAQKLSGVYELLTGNEYSDSLPNTLKVASGQLSDLREYLPELSEFSDKLEGFGYEIEEIASSVNGFLSRLYLDPNALEEIEERLDELFRLSKKYGQTEEDILAFADRCREELSSIENVDESIDKLEKQYSELYGKMAKAASELSYIRKSSALLFSKRICDELKFLDMQNAVFEVSFKNKDYSSNGCDSVEFFMSANKGEDAKPLSKIASGGELSRVMLAIKNVLQDKDPVCTLIFDEIDTGISGSAARKVGIKMKEVASNRQVLCVTHLAQIASLADTHYRIEKHSDGIKTYTEVSKLDYDSRVEEIARIMSTGVTTDLMRASAKELIDF